VFWNRVLRKVIGPKGGQIEGTGADRIKRNFMDLYSSPNIIMVIRLKKKG
jgi:hypothetical protein